LTTTHVVEWNEMRNLEWMLETPRKDTIYRSLISYGINLQWSLCCHNRKVHLIINWLLAHRHLDIIYIILGILTKLAICFTLD